MHYCSSKLSFHPCDRAFQTVSSQPLLASSLLCWLAFSRVASSHLFLALLFSRVCLLQARIGDWNLDLPLESPVGFSARLKRCMWCSRLVAQLLEHSWTSLPESFNFSVDQPETSHRPRNSTSCTTAIYDYYDNTSNKTLLYSISRQ